MPVLKIPDAGGATITVFEHNGHYYPGDQVGVIDDIPDVTIRDDDVIIYAYPKSGTHWLWEIVRLLLAGECDLDVQEKHMAMLEFRNNEELSNMASPRTLNTHVPVSALPKGIFEKKNKIISIIRNPKDMAVSFYNHHIKIPQLYGYYGEWKDYLPLILEGKVDSGSWFDFTWGWINLTKEHPELPALTLVYEDLKEDPMAGIKKLNTFLEVNRSEEFMHRVKDLTSFDKMKATKGHILKAEDGSAIMYRKGEVGDWKNYFTVAQNEMFDKVYKEMMAGCDINVRYTL